MKVLKAKGARSFRKFGVKLPIALVEKIEELDAKVKENGFQVDWSEPCVEALQRYVSAVEADLKEIPPAA
ncbi:hypothetical protein [Acidovorax sp. FJL06]|uniref:hypothetical protein n=1 Tax=Acidovorax sp. FJL06 TaxID=2153365 RepID=UPI000F57D7B5|nr:hypothetical protein [Acidovorax sp. FJL06]